MGGGADLRVERCCAPRVTGYTGSGFWPRARLGSRIHRAPQGALPLVSQPDYPLRILRTRDLAENGVETIEVVAGSLALHVASSEVLLVQEVGVHVSQLYQIRVHRVPVHGVLDQSSDRHLPIAIAATARYRIVHAHSPR